eukprot:256939_1
MLASMNATTLRLGILVSLLIFEVYSTVYTRCIENINDAATLTTNDQIISDDGNIAFKIDGNGDPCLETSENGQSTKRWCLLFLGVEVTPGGKFVAKSNGNLTYVNSANIQIWSSDSATPDVSPLQLCIADCGRIMLRRQDNNEEIWNPDYVPGSTPTTYPSCVAPSFAPSFAPSRGMLHFTMDMLFISICKIQNNITAPTDAGN